LNAYVNGMQFILLALEGRLEEETDLDEADLRDFMDEYHQMAMRIRSRSELPVSR